MIKSLCFLILFDLLVEEIFLHAEAACNQSYCMNRGKHYCTDYTLTPPKKYNLPPNNKRCEDIGCADEGKRCYCKSNQDKDCTCEDITPPCDPVKCTTSGKLCYCYIGSAPPKQCAMPPSKDCRDLLIDLGANNGTNFCAVEACNCDQYSRCSCIPPKSRTAKSAFRGFPPPTDSKCGPENCNKNSNEYCHCTCNNKSCSYNRDIFTNLSSNTQICDEMVNSYSCTNAGSKCNCLPDGSCNCVTVDPCFPIDTSCNQCPSYSDKGCLCNFKGLRIKINSQVTNCSSLLKSKKGDIPMDSCPHQVGKECKCELNIKKKNKCICRTANPFDSPPIIAYRQNPFKRCAIDDDCSAYTEFYCACTNSVDRTYVKPYSLRSTDDVNSVCKGIPPNIICKGFGYVSKCTGGQCCLTGVGLANGPNYSQ